MLDISNRSLQSSVYMNMTQMAVIKNIKGKGRKVQGATCMCMTGVKIVV